MTKMTFVFGNWFLTNDEFDRKVDALTNEGEGTVEEFFGDVFGWFNKTMKAGTVEKVMTNLGTKRKRTKGRKPTRNRFLFDVTFWTLAFGVPGFLFL